MRLTLDRDLFDIKSAAEAIVLVELFSVVARDFPPHAVLTNPPYLLGGDNGSVDVWLGGRSSFEAEAFRRVLAEGPLIAAGPRGAVASDSAQPRRWHLAGPLEVHVERRPMSDWMNRQLTLADAIDLLREPVHLLLENERTEFAFVRHLAGATNGASLWTLLEQPGRLRTHGGGGGEAKKWIEALTKGPPTSAMWRRILRTWMLFDNDAGDTDVRDLSRSAAALIKLCEDVFSIRGPGLSWIGLRRREIESYVPDGALKAEAPVDRAEFVKKVISWRADPNMMTWAWALDLKKGLHGDLHDHVSQGDRKALKDRTVALGAQMLKAPFVGLPPGDISTLGQGLGDRLGEALRADPDRSWTSDIPAEYDRGPPDQAPRLSLVQSLFDRM